jgi:hypothetical protein
MGHIAFGYILFACAVVLLISFGYFILGLFDLLLEKVLRHVAKKMYRKQTQEAIAQVLNK